MKRIAFVTYEFPPDRGKGGIGTYMSNISALLAHIGWNVEVFASSPTRTETSTDETGVIINWIISKDPLDFQSKVPSFFDIRHAIKPFDIIEAPEIHANAREIKLKYPNIPLIVRIHCPNYLVESLKKIDTPFFVKLRFFLGALKRGRWDLGFWNSYNKKGDEDYEFTKTADIISAPSRAMKSWAVDNWKIKAESIYVFPNPFLMPVIKHKQKLESNSKLIVFFGRLNVLKGLIPLTKAMKKVLSKYKDWKWRIIGDDCASHIQGITMKDWMLENLKGLEGQLEWYDGQKYQELMDLISECEIAVLPSYFESYSYTCVEAMAAKLVVIGSKNGGMADLLQKGAGVLVNPFSTTEIQENLNTLIEDDILRVKYKEVCAGRLQLLDNQKLNEFYNQLLPVQ